MTKLLITTIPWFDEGEYDAVDPIELINVLTLFDDADWLVIGTDRYTLDMHHEQEYRPHNAGKYYCALCGYMGNDCASDSHDDDECPKCGADNWWFTETRYHGAFNP